MAHNAPFTSATPAKPADVPYAVQPENNSFQPGKPVDLEVDDGFTRGQWAVGFWDCFTDLMPNCFMVTCCACVSMAQIADRLGVTKFSKALLACFVVVAAEFVLSALASSAGSSSVTVESDVTSTGQTSYSYSTSSGSGAMVLVLRLIMLAVRVVFALFVCHLRMKTRERFDIPGDRKMDFLVSLCCSCCALAQMATHVKSYTRGSCDFRPVVDTLPPYSS